MTLVTNFGFEKRCYFLGKRNLMLICTILLFCDF